MRCDESISATRQPYLDYPSKRRFTVLLPPNALRASERGHPPPKLFGGPARPSLSGSLRFRLYSVFNASTSLSIDPEPVEGSKCNSNDKYTLNLPFCQCFRFKWASAFSRSFRLVAKVIRSFASLKGSQRESTCSKES